MVEEVVRDYRDRYPDAGITVDVPADCHVLGGEYLRQAIRELVENGFEHAEGTPAVTIEASAGGPSGHEPSHGQWPRPARTGTGRQHRKGIPPEVGR